MAYAVAGVARRGKRWHSRVESASAETSTHRQRVPTSPRPADLAAVRDRLEAGPTGRMLVDADVVDSEPSWWLEKAFRVH